MIPSSATPRARRTHALRRIAAAAALAPVLAAGTVLHARASTTGPPSAGTCVFNGQATFSPALHLSPAAGIQVTVTGSGTCYGAGIPLGEQVDFTPTFTGIEPLASCALGEGSMAGSLNFSGNIPVAYIGGATYVGGPALATVTIATTDLVGTATLAWSNPSAVLACPTSGTASTPLTGLFTFVAP